MTESFDEIRPYSDNEVEDVLESLISDQELLIALGRYRMPRLSRWLPAISNHLVQANLRKALEGIQSVSELQSLVAPIVGRLVRNTITDFEIKGLERLKRDQAYLFISNHRDIAMDPALVNYALYQEGFGTSRIGIGDNLIRKPYVSKLMRLNKSFIVRRSVQGRKEKMEALLQLSNYIYSSIQQGSPVWLAQKEGRAKDGRDETDTAVLKMLHMGRRKQGWQLSESLNQLNIVPVSISYEWDPCDQMKARELASVSSGVQYTKHEDEDYMSIVKGLQGEKGGVTIHFGEPLNMSSNRAEDWSQAIDDFIHSHYKIYPNGYQAYMKLFGELPNQVNASQLKQDQELTRRLEGLSPEEQKHLLSAYAQPVCYRYEDKHKEPDAEQGVE